MTTTLTAFDSYRLDTKFSDDGASFVHTIPGALPGEKARAERWARVERIGKGTFGSVYKEESDNGDVRAVKVVLNSVMNIRELLALTRMTLYSDHFVQLSGWFQDDTNIYLAMEYFPCGDLHTLILESQGGLSSAQIRTVTVQLLEGLKIMHSLSFCHRDLKPQNVLIVTWFPLVVKIADFGTTKEAGDETAFRTIVGTPDYLAPEVLGIMDSDTSEYTDAVDIWSMGCLVFAMATKKTPFPGTKGLEAFLKGSPFPGERLMESELRVFIMSLMRPLPQERPTAEQALSDVWLGGILDTWNAQANLNDSPPSLKISTGPTGIQVPTDLDDDYDTWERGNGIDGAPAMPGSSTDHGPEIRPDMKRIGVALTEAAAHGHREIVQRMLDTGADLTFRDHNGNTALHRAVQRGHTNIVRLLLVAGADKMAKGFGDATPLIMAAACGYKELVQLLVDGGTDITATDGDGYTVLHAAAQNGYADLVRFLLEHEGMDIALGSDTGVATPLHLAALGGWTDVVKLLLEKGANINERGPRGFTALHSAASRGKLEAVKLLLDEGADRRVRTVSLSTALTLAATDGHEKVVKLLLNHGAEIMEKGPHGYTALHLAAEEGHINVVLLLLQRGADFAATENEGLTALHLATAAGCLEVVELLIGWGEGTDLQGSGIDKLQNQAQLNYTSIANGDSLLLDEGPKGLNTMIGAAGISSLPGQGAKSPIIEESVSDTRRRVAPALQEDERTFEEPSLQNKYGLDSLVGEPTLPNEVGETVEAGPFQGGSRTSSPRREGPTRLEREREAVEEERLQLGIDHQHSRARVQPKLDEAAPGINTAGSTPSGKRNTRIHGWRSRLDKRLHCAIS